MPRSTIQWSMALGRVQSLQHARGQRSRQTLASLSTVRWSSAVHSAIELACTGEARARGGRRNPAARSVLTRRLDLEANSPAEQSGGRYSRPPLWTKVTAMIHSRHFWSKVAAVSTGRFCREMVRTAMFFKLAHSCHSGPKSKVAAVTHGCHYIHSGPQSGGRHSK